MTATAFELVALAICVAFGGFFLCNVVYLIKAEIKAQRARKELANWITEFNKIIDGYGTDRN